jgi:hypothetical protein
MKHILLNANDKNIELVEKLRYETYNQEIPVNILDTFYAQKLKGRENHFPPFVNSYTY